MQGTANPHTKIRRAKIHLDSLETELRLFAERKPYRFISHDDVESDQYIVQVLFETPEIWPIGAILGDFVCCLRSALDHLVYGLVTLHSGAPKIKVSFPIISEFFDKQTIATIRQCTLGMPDDAVFIIESLQPYHARGNYRESLFYKLNTLWNIDKHRHIPLHSGGMQFDFPLLTVEHTIHPLDDGFEARFPLSRKPDVKLDPHLITPLIFFGSDADGVKLTFSELAEIYQFIGYSVIPRFTRFYQQPKITG
jgi:hypothetical protein